MAAYSETLLGRVRLASVTLALVLFLFSSSAFSVETDQFLTWDVELDDSTVALNEFFNDEIQAILDGRNRAIEPTCECAPLTEDIFFHFFKRRRTSRLKMFLRASDGVELYPDREISNYGYRHSSIYRNYTFPYIIPLARTLRVGDVYFGIDKFGHMFGFGSRYYKRYRKYLRMGFTEDEAIEKVVRRGIVVERLFVGEYLDGVFSHGDLEANFQGFLLSRDMCEGEDAYLKRIDEQWVFTRPIDLRDYITPDFDESWNLSHWWADRKREVIPILKDEYADKLQSPLVQERFSRYRDREPSRSKLIVQEYYNGREKHPQLEQSVLAFDGPPAFAIDDEAPVETDLESPDPERTGL